MSYWESDPLLFAYDATGALKHIDKVPNGSNCGCICPGCKQPLVAKNGGQKLIHHFAHKKGACRWAVETTVIMIARDILEEHKTMTVVGAAYDDKLAETWQEMLVIVSPHGKLAIDKVEVIETEGRKAPVLKITCTDKKGAKSEFVLVAVISNRVSEQQLAHLQDKTESGIVLALDLKSAYAGMRDRHGRHFSRGEFFLKAQDPDILKSILLDEESELQFSVLPDEGGTEVMPWLSHPYRDECEAKANAEYRRQIDAELRAREEKWKAYEIETFEAEGVETLPIVRDGVRLCADGCPIHGRADIAFDCGDILGNDDRCIFFEGRRYYLIGCTAHQNGIGLEDDEEEMDGCEEDLDDDGLADRLVAKALEAYSD